MKLRAQSLWFVVASTGGFFLLVAAAGLWVMLPAADDADRRDMEARLERLDSRVAQQIEQIRVYAHEYGPWTETVEFIAGRRPEFVEENFNAEQLTGSGMQVIAVWADDGRRVFSRGAATTPDEARELSDPVLAALEAWPRLVQREPGTSSEGVVATPLGPLLLSAHPVTPNERTPPSRGTFVAGQFLDAELLALLSAGENHEIELLPPGAEAGSDGRVDFVDTRTMRGVWVLRGADGAPAARVALSAPRFARQVQARGLWIVFGALALGGGLLALLAWRLHFAPILRRVEALTEGVGRLENDAATRARLAAQPGDDELAQLARDTGTMAEKLARAREAAEAATRAKGDFLAAMSHEIRTPLNGVLGYLGLLRDTPLNEEQREHVRVIEESGDGLLGVINEILDFSKLESGRVELESIPTDAPGIAGEVLALFTPRLKAKRVAGALEVAPGVPSRVLADPLRLRQVLTNLVSNAEKFTAAGEVRVRLAPLPEGREGLRIEVVDTGIGLTPAQLARGFRPFTQGDNSTTRHYGGTGLGLAITERLVRAWGGELTVNSEPGRGSAFGFTLPARVSGGGAAPSGAAAGRTVGAGSEERDAPPALPPLRILMAEDNAVNARLLGAILAKFGQRAEHVTDGRAALRAMENDAYDIVLMDVQMPELDGMEATRRQRAREKTEGRAPLLIAALTANALAGAREECLAAGMDDHLAKPYHATQVRSLLERAAARRAQPC